MSLFFFDTINWLEIYNAQNIRNNKIGLFAAVLLKSLLENAEQDTR